VAKIFGVALDAADDPWSLQLKQAWMARDSKKDDWFLAYSDPYDAVINNVADILERGNVKLAGKFPVPSWLSPRPESDICLVTAQNVQHFFDKGGILMLTKQLQSFVTERILPEMPIMIGIDHSATGGVISALAERYGPKALSVVILDHHFDAFPLSVRLGKTLRTSSDFGACMYPVSPLCIEHANQYCCGNFLAHLIDTEQILPENLLLIGVADYPRQGISQGCDSLRESYLKFERSGCSFFPSWRFDGEYLKDLTQFLHERITTRYVYVSLDLDVGAYRCVHAARYMDGTGIDRESLLAVAHIIATECRHGAFDLVGFDVMEFNMHSLGIKVSRGTEDLTMFLVRDFISALVDT